MKPVISVDADSVTIKGFTIETERRVVPIIYLNSDDNIISNNIFKGDMVSGISIGKSSNNIISDNNFVTNGYNGITIDTEGYFSNSKEYWDTHVIENNLLNNRPIYYYKDNEDSFIIPFDASQVILANCSNVIINNITISNCFYGIQLGYSDYINIENNEVIDCGIGGISLIFSNNNEFNNNTLRNCSNGILIEEYSNNNIVDSNIFTDNNNGVTQRHSSNTMISNNIFTDSEFSAIYLDSDSTNTIVTRNQIIDNDYGISYGSQCYGNKIYENNFSNCSDAAIWIYPNANNDIYLNNFINNTKDVISGSDDTNNWDNGTHGNYWDNYIGTDSDEDGIGDTSYIISSDLGIQDFYPLMDPVSI